jgi:hypothetical protein
LRASAIALAAALALTACGSGSGDDVAKPNERSLEPKFKPAATVTSTSVSKVSTTSSGAAAGAGSSSTTTTASAPAAARAGDITDQTLDVSPSPLDRPPAWADLVGAHLTRDTNGFELRVRLGGGDAPESSGDDAHTMNVASFYDVDGDGKIDYEVWANIASGGWGASYFDDVHHSGGYLDDSGVTVSTDGDEIVLRFPLDHVGNADHFRWSIASEWGRYAVIGTDQAARDEAPDGGAASDFPSP